jgi:hypothetical protein
VPQNSESTLDLRLNASCLDNPAPTLDVRLFDLTCRWLQADDQSTQGSDRRGRSGGLAKRNGEWQLIGRFGRRCGHGGTTFP